MVQAILWVGREEDGPGIRSNFQGHTSGILLLSRPHLQFPTDVIKKERYMEEFEGREGNRET